MSKLDFAEGQTEGLLQDNPICRGKYETLQLKILEYDEKVITPTSDKTNEKRYD